MNAVDPTRLFVEAELAFGSGQFAIARDRLDKLARSITPHPAVLHLSGLVHRRLARMSDAVTDLARAAALAPHDADIQHNLGNALFDIDDVEGATEAYRAALALRPGFAQAARSLGQACTQLRRWEEARSALEHAIGIEPGQPANWSALGALELAADDHDAAAAAFDRALTLQPRHRTALTGRARVALDRGDADATARHDAALAQSPQDWELALGAAQLVAPADALARLEALLVKYPDWLEGHRTYARLASESGEEAVDKTFQAARSQRPDDCELALAHLATLLTAHRFGDVLVMVGELPDNARGTAATWEVEGVAATGVGDWARANVALARLEKLDPLRAALPLARLALRCGDPARATAALWPGVEDGRATVADWAYLSLAWRLLDDPRESWLHGRPELVTTIDLDLDAERIAALTKQLRALHRGRAHPLGQSMRGGTQTTGRLFARADPLMRGLAAELTSAVERYRAALPPADPAHPVLRHRDQPWRLAGSWSVRLMGSGFHINHIHPQGVVSSAAYIHLPDALEGEAGWLTLGEPPVELALALGPVQRIEPRVGRLALFPSTLFHGTVPFKLGERLTVAFDAAPS